MFSFYFSVFYREKMLPTSFIHQSKANISAADEDLHVFIIDHTDIKKSLQMLTYQLHRRDRSNREFWLIDIAALGSLDTAELMLNSLQLDLDDDILLFHFSSDDMATIWEIYKLRPEMELIVKELATWTRNKGIEMKSLDKWKRRGNLMVASSLSITLVPFHGVLF